MKRNYYDVLGVMPTAESVVITAAYRALANRYHPDKNIADPIGSSSKMAEVNAAYETLSDPEKRKRYDQSLKENSRESKIADNETSEAFSDALSALEAKWSIAVKVFPDLILIRSRLDKIASSLSFSFVSYLLETKDFESRQKIAKSLEDKYFQTYFGENQKIVDFAKEIIELDVRQALVALNNYLEVLGSEIDPQPIINAISKEYNLKQKRSEYWAANKSKEAMEEHENELGVLYQDVLHHGYIDSALKILNLKGFEFEISKSRESGGLFSFGKSSIYSIFKDGKMIASNLDADDILRWVADNLI